MIDLRLESVRVEAGECRRPAGDEPGRLGAGHAHRVLGFSAYQIRVSAGARRCPLDASRVDPGLVSWARSLAEAALLPLPGSAWPPRWLAKGCPATA